MFESESPRYLVAEEQHASVGYHDILGCGQPTPLATPILDEKKGHLKYDAEIADWLRGQMASQGTNFEGPVSWPRHDPHYRFVYIQAANSRSNLKITKRSLSRVLTYHQVMPEYLDAISLLGKVQNTPRNPTHYFFRQRTRLGNAAGPCKVVELGRSGQGFQMCYSLRDTRCGSNGQYSIRPAAFHHQFDSANGKSLWMAASGHQEIESRLNSYASAMSGQFVDGLSSPAESFRITLNVHLLNAEWALAGWATHGNWLDNDIRIKTEEAVKSHVIGTMSDEPWNPNCLPEIQGLEEKIALAEHALEGNIQVLNSLREYYLQLLDNPDFSHAQNCAEDINAFADGINAVVEAFRAQKLKAKHQRHTTQQRKELIAENIQSQATEKVEALSVSARKIGLCSQREAAFMRIIALVTLIYLPATFTSTFFSAGVLNFKDPQGDDYLSIPGLTKWLEVTAPFTIFTLILALGFYLRYKRRFEEDQEQIPVARIQRRATFELEKV